jgi:hypothetical protein
VLSGGGLALSTDWIPKGFMVVLSEVKESAPFSAEKAAKRLL